MTNLNENSTGVSARRRLIRGAFSAPAVLTLYSGSAFALASNLRCVANQVSNPVYPAASTGQDFYVRVPLFSLGQQGNLSTWIRGADVVALKGSKSINTYLSSTAWQCYSAGPGSGYTANQILYSAPTTPQGGSPTASGSYVAVRVDSSGNIVGVVGVNGSSGSAVAQTCWVSFLANPAA